MDLIFKIVYYNYDPRFKVYVNSWTADHLCVDVYNKETGKIYVDDCIDDGQKVSILLSLLKL